MKKFLFLTLALFTCINLFGQDTIYVKNRCIHYKSDCSKLSGDNYEIITDKNIISRIKNLYYSCDFCGNQGKTLIHEENPGNDGIKELSLYKAGSYLKKSANLQIAGFGFLAGGGILGLIHIEAENPNLKRPLSSSGRKAFVTGYILLGIGALTCEFLSIHYKYKAGKSLQISPTNITYNF